MNKLDIGWLYPLKRKLIFGILGILSLSIVATTVFIYVALRDGLAQNNRLRTLELSNAVKAGLKSLMMTREPDRIQNTLDGLIESGGSIVKAQILDRRGKIIYSTDRKELGRTLDRFSEQSCRPCHGQNSREASQDAMFISNDGREIYRNITVIYNEKSCFGCHAAADRINGKLIIDRSPQGMYALVTLIELIIFGSGIACLALLVPFLSWARTKGLDTYINEITHQHSELSLLYAMIERLSKTIDVDELKGIIVDILKDTLEADEMDIVLPRVGLEYRAASWSRKENEIVRKRIDARHPLRARLALWIGGESAATEVSADRREVVLPIVKGGVPLALLAARRSDAPFSNERIRLVEVIRSHITVALENARLYQIAISDELTGLFTQRHFRTCIEKSIGDCRKYGEKFSLLMLDIDDFKQVNDTFGHVVGDAVLRDIARVIQSCIRDNDLAFRYGGEEFTVLLAATGPGGGRHVAERIRVAVQEAVFEKGRNNIHLTISIGCANCPETAETVRDLILEADKRLYEAKRTGKNRVVAGDEPS